MAETWAVAPPVRNITICKGEDKDLGGRLSKNKVAWTPPSGTTIYFVVYIKDASDLTLNCTIVDDSFSIHIEESVCDTIPDGAAFWFYVKTPDTASGNPKCICTGTVQRIDPEGAD